jgi:predicted ribosome quality control (RQC) complex YloA/Tae2 family protein
VAPGRPADWHDADVVGAASVALLPVPVLGGLEPPPESWTEAAALVLEARLRGRAFEAARRRALDEARQKRRRLGQLLGHLEHDARGLPDAAELRRDAEALLAAPGAPLRADRDVEVPDPYLDGAPRRIAVDPGLSVPQNANRLFDKARRIERARRHIEARRQETAESLREAEAREQALAAARDLAELGPAGAGSAPERRASEPGGRAARHYLTSKGLSILVGRGSRENHHLTFSVARPEDLWLHARDVPGAHVILKDNEGRAGAEDLREAAEVAAFFSDAGREAQVDVHVTRRKHLRPVRGAPGRVTFGHTDTLRVAPLDPEGRLRRR